MSKVVVLGAGQWGTTMAQVLCDAGNHVLMWGRNQDVVDEINNKHTNSKYLDDNSLPIGLRATSDLQEAAIEAFIALGCSGLARVDFFYTDDDAIIINELNTMPGFTPKSVFPKLWGVSGLGYTDIISALIETALNKSNQ